MNYCVLCFDPEIYWNCDKQIHEMRHDVCCAPSFVCRNVENVAVTCIWVVDGIFDASGRDECVYAMIGVLLARNQNTCSFERQISIEVTAQYLQILGAERCSFSLAGFKLQQRFCINRFVCMDKSLT